MKIILKKVCKKFVDTIYHCIFASTKQTNTMQSTITKNIYLSLEEFDRDLEICLEIIDYPSSRKPYYVCKYTSASLNKSIVHIYITK